MAETHPKRQREETHIEDDSKRHKFYNQILSILDDEEDEPTQDLSEIFTTFQQELSSDFPDFDPLPKLTRDSDQGEDFTVVLAPSDCSPSSSGSHTVLKEDDEKDEKERVIRHLLEASDDELGLPLRVDGGDDEVEINGGDNSFAFCDGLWEIEDEAANYYTLLQSELFM